MKSPRQILLAVSMIYFTFCVSAGLNITFISHQIAVNAIVLYWALIVIRHLFLLRYASVQTPVPQPLPRRELPGVSIIVPAFNEDRVIEDALSSLLHLNYPEYEVIVVDDGSTDGTRDATNVVKQWAKVPIRYIRQRNSGKSAALNLGITHARNAFILCIDADSKIHPDALLQGISRDWGDIESCTGPDSGAR